MRSLTAKLLAGFLAVALVTVLVVAIAANRATDAAFTSYVRQGQSQQLQRLQSDLANYYAGNGSWSNVQPYLDTSSGMGGMGMGMGRGMGQGHGAPQDAGMNQQAILADAQGVIIAASGAAPSSSRLSQREMASALPISVDGQTVGYVLAQGSGISTFSALEQQFLATTNRALILASLVAAGLAVIISLFVARRMTAPLISMTGAAQAMARGDLSQRVHIESQDETGRLAGAFNTMAASLARAEDLRRNLVADIAHELRTPIAVLRADLEALQDGIYQPTPERMAVLYEETSLLSRLVADLHELSLADSGKLVLERRPTDLVQLCRQTVGVMETQAASRGITLAMTPAGDDAISAVDPDRIGQVLRNLIGNALRYTPSGGSVTVACKSDGSDNTISVTDTGAGISAEDLPHVFERFYRGEKSRSRATGGAGLGLAIVRQLVEAHGGQVWAENAPGQGAAFYVRLPRAPMS